MFAGLLEIGWPVGLKMAQTEGQRLIGVVLALAFMFGSGFRQRPIQTYQRYATGVSDLKEQNGDSHVHD
jgi:quaternary ammonium compound-resistance protein SugE